MTGKPMGQKILAQLTNALNRFLRLDSDLHYVIQPLVGQSIQITITDYPVSAILHICEDGFLIHFDQEESNLSITGRLADFIQLCISKDPQALIRTGAVDVKGSIKLLTDLNRFCSRFSPDIEGELSKWIGTPIAHHVSKASLKSATWLKKNFKLAETDFIEFLQEELKLLPSMQEFRALASDIQDIQSDIERLEAKMHALSQVLIHENQY